MAYVLAVKVTPTSTAFCALGGTERLVVTDELGASQTCLNYPDTTATLGGQLKVFLVGGVNFVTVPYAQSAAGGIPSLPLDVITVLLIGPVPGEAGQGRAA